jgi:hypothetical protein
MARTSTQLGYGVRRPKVRPDSRTTRFESDSWPAVPEARLRIRSSSSPFAGKDSPLGSRHQLARMEIESTL